MALRRRLQHPAQRRSRRPRAGVGAEGPARRHHCAQQRRLAPLRREIRDGHRPPAQYLIEPLAAEPADVLAQAQQVPQLRRRRPVDRRRHQAHQPIEHARDVVGRCLELRPALGVPRRPGRQRLRRLRRIARENQRAAVHRWREDRRLGPHDVQPLLLETEIACDVVADDARVRESGSAKAGMDLVRDRATSDFAASLEDQRLVARACETGRRHQPVVARADDDRPHARSCRTA